MNMIVHKHPGVNLNMVYSGHLLNDPATNLFYLGISLHFQVKDTLTGASHHMVEGFGMVEFDSGFSHSDAMRYQNPCPTHRNISSQTTGYKEAIKSVKDS